MTDRTCLFRIFLVLGLVHGISPLWCLGYESGLSDEQIRETLLLYYPGTAEKKLERLKTLVRSLPPPQQMVLHYHIQPWGGDPAASKRAETWLREIHKQDSALGKKTREDIFPRLNSIRYGDEGVSVDQFQATLLRAYRGLDADHLRAWRAIVEGLPPGQRALFDDYILMLEMEKTDRRGAGDRLYRRVVENPAEFRAFEGTLNALNRALERQAYMWVMFRSFDESDWTLRSYRSDVPRPPQDIARTKSATLTRTRTSRSGEGDTTNVPADAQVPGDGPSRVETSTEAVTYWYIRRPDGACSVHYKGPSLSLDGKRKYGRATTRLDENCKPVTEPPEYLDHIPEGSVERRRE